MNQNFRKPVVIDEDYLLIPDISENPELRAAHAILELRFSQSDDVTIEDCFDYLIINDINPETANQAAELFTNSFNESCEEFAELEF